MVANVVLALALLAPVFSARHGHHPSQVPVFRGSTDVVVVDVQVVDRGGRPAEGLAPADFTLKVDGKVRAITSVQFQTVDERARLVRPAAAAATLPDTLAAPPAASYVLFVADPAIMRPEPSRILFDQAARLMETMSPDHVTGLLVVPARAPQFPFSPLRRPLAAALRKELGSFSGRTFGESQVLASVSALEAGIDALRDVDGRRTLVYFSDFLPDYAEENIKDVAWHANAADVAIYVVSSDGLVLPGASSRTAPRPPRPGGEFGPLPMLADLTGGAFLRRVVSGAMVFDRLERELSAQYVLAFDVLADDRNGKRHRIDVKVNRKDVDVRFRREFVR